MEVRDLLSRVMGALPDRPSLEVAVVSLATHFAAVLLGVSSAAALQDDAWPAAARGLPAPAIVLALPAGFPGSAGLAPGIEVQVIRPGTDPCALHRDHMTLLSNESAVMISREMTPDAVSGLASVAHALNAGDELVIAGLVGDGLRKCREQNVGDVVVERHEEP